MELIRDEEISFAKTLDRGSNCLKLAANAQKSKLIAAEDAFKLHDTYGFPIDLTRIMAEERGISVDIAGYEKLMEQARELRVLADARMIRSSPVWRRMCWRNWRGAM